MQHVCDVLSILLPCHVLASILVMMMGQRQTAYRPSNNIHNYNHDPKQYIQTVAGTTGNSHVNANSQTNVAVNQHKQYTEGHKRHTPR